jgi:deoxyribonuclease V
VATRKCTFPYVPGLLSFRELPCILASFRKLRGLPQAVLYDGQGLAHPRRIGIACHLGLWLGIPTVGCAKSRLCGTYDDPPPPRGARSLLD